MKIAILDDYAGVALEMADWARLGSEITVFRDTVKDEAALIARLQPFEALCIMRERTPLPARVIEALPALKLIVTSGARNFSVDLDAAKARGVVVSGTETRKTTTAELTLLLMLALSRRLTPEAASLNSGGWQIGLGRDLGGLTLGIIGLGKIGEQVMTLARAFGMEGVAWSQNLTDARCAEVGVERMESLGALFARADVSTIHLVLSDRSRGLVGREALAHMKPDGALVNTSRGPIVDSAALVEALRAEPGRQAAIDVYDQEPPPAAHPLLDADLIARGQLLLTPHLGYATEQTWRIFYPQMVDAIEAWRRGAPIRVLA